MKRLMTVLVAAAFAAACAVDVATAPQDEVEADMTAIDLEPGVAHPEGPANNCSGFVLYDPGMVMVPIECLEGAKYYYMGDPWTGQAGDVVPVTRVVE